MSKLDLDAIEARAEAATDGPWMVGAEVSKDLGIVNAHWFGSVDPEVGIILGEAGLHDAEFIAAARTDVPALVARVRELEATVERMRRARAEVPMPFCERDGKIVRDLLLKLNAAEAGERS